VPAGWPRFACLFNGYGSLKIAECMSLAGDRGRYFYGLLDIDDDYLQYFIELLGALSNILLKTNERKDRDEFQQRLVMILARLEYKLPVYWSSAARHHLLHIFEKNGDMGAFWTHNMLWAERFHVILKSLARGSKHKMRSIAKHYDMFDISQTDWRFDQLGWSSAPKRSTLVAAHGIPEGQGIVTITGSKTPARLCPSDFSQVQDLWCIDSKVLDLLRDRYNLPIVIQHINLMKYSPFCLLKRRFVECHANSSYATFF
jgi:hypothetical protein